MWRAVGLVLVVGTASARPIKLEVTTDSCPNLSHEIDGDFVSDASASVRVDEHDRTATITLDVDNRTFGARVIHAETCDELARSVAVVVAMLLPSITGLSTPLVAVLPERPDVPSPPEAHIEPGAYVSTRADVEQPAHRAFEMSAIGGVSSARGMGLTVGARWRSGTASLGAELAGALEDVADDHVSVRRTSAALVPCRDFNTLAVCGLVRVGLDVGVGQGLMDAQTAWDPRFEVGSRLIWERPVTDRLSLALSGELGISLTSSQFDVDHVAVWRSSHFEGLAGAGVVVRFP
jgi:hypothetical protein